MPEAPTDVSPRHLTHAGGVVLRDHGGRTECLLIRATPPPHDWVLPKGYIDQGETPEACARRDVAEEAGVDAVVEGLLGDDACDTPGRATSYGKRFEPSGRI